MRRQILIIVTICFLLSCSNDSEEVNIQKRIQSDSSAKVATILFSSPQVIDSSQIIIYPLILEKTSSGSGLSSSSGLEKTSFWNLIFFNANNNTQHLLTIDKRIVINSINMDGNSSSSSSSSDIWKGGINIYDNNIFYDVVSKDLNQNNYLDVDDPTYLYVSDKQGNNFRQLSPDNYNITSWNVVKGTSKIILQVQKDNNGDKRFDQNDELIPFIVDVNTGKLATETFNNTYIDSLKKVLTNTWKTNRK